MAWLTINGINLAKVVAVASDPSDERRDVGAQTTASDGSMVLTRSARKSDFKFSTRVLTSADALAWEGLLVGLSEVWSFDVSRYSAKGEAGIPSSAPDVEVQATTKKYGAKALKITGGETLTTASLWGREGFYDGGVWTIAGWHNVNLGGWVHLVIRSDGKKWVDGIRNDSYSTAYVPTFTSGALELDATPSNVYWDDLVVSPFLWPIDWAPQVFASGQPFGPTPFLTAAGDMVPEAATRRMLCASLSNKVLIAGLEGQLRRTARVMTFELKGA